MTENNQPKTKISESERFHLDTYGFAQLATEAPRTQTPAMQEMYNAFLDEHDPLISKTIMEADMAKRHIAAKGQYDATPEDQKGEAEDPGQVNEHLAKSLNTLNQATLLYAEKRDNMYAELTTTQALDYHSRKDGKLIVDTPENVIAAIKETSGKIEDLETDDLTLSSLRAIDDYKIHGDLNSRVQRGIAKRNLEAISLALEEQSE